MTRGVLEKPNHIGILLRYLGNDLDRWNELIGQEFNHPLRGIRCIVGVTKLPGWRAYSVMLKSENGYYDAAIVDSNSYITWLTINEGMRVQLRQFFNQEQQAWKLTGKVMTPVALGQRMMDPEGAISEAILASLSWKTPEAIDTWREDYLYRKGLLRQSEGKLGYRNHCWQCKHDILGERDIQCVICTYFECGFCRACLCGRPYPKLDLEYRH